MPCPRISVIMACRNAAPTVDAALWSVRRQTLADLQIVAVDDGSTDETAQRLAAHAAADPRVIVLAGQGQGPGAARNLALDRAAGEWLAIMDGDDVMHPRRLETLLSKAADTGADAVGDNLLAFYDRQAAPPYLLISGEDWRQEYWIGLSSFIGNNCMRPGEAPLGYLKPLLRRTAVGDMRYDPSLRIGEDYDFVARLLLSGLRFRFLPEALYFYRRHEASTSWRLSEADVAALIAAAEALEPRLPTGDAREASVRRRAALADVLGVNRTLSALKGRRPVDALVSLVRRPGAVPGVAQALSEAVAKRLRRAGTAAVPPERVALVLSRPDEPLDEAAACLARLGLRVEHLRLPSGPVPVDAQCAAASLAGSVDVVLAGDDALAEAAAYVVSPEAVVAVLGCRAEAADLALDLAPDGGHLVECEGGGTFTAGALREALTCKRRCVRPSLQRPPSDGPRDASTPPPDPAVAAPGSARSAAGPGPHRRHATR